MMTTFATGPKHAAPEPLFPPRVSSTRVVDPKRTPPLAREKVSDALSLVERLPVAGFAILLFVVALVVSSIVGAWGWHVTMNLLHATGRG